MVDIHSLISVDKATSSRDRDADARDVRELCLYVRNIDDSFKQEANPDSTEVDSEKRGTRSSSVSTFRDQRDKNAEDHVKFLYRYR